jgi:putative phosphoesterase
LIRIGLISDTHDFLDENIFRHFENCDEIWHAGDWGEGVFQKFKEFKKFQKLKGVYGNIDDLEIRTEFPEYLQWKCEEVNVFMVHIGQPYWKSLHLKQQNKPSPLERVWERLPQLFICGHSHILKIMYDEKISCLYMNPGAAGKQGWHKMRTIVRFVIDGEEIKDCEVIELGSR